MKRLKFDDKQDDEYSVEEIITAMKKAGYEISEADARAAWEKYSESMAAGWMMFPSEEEIVDIVRSYCKEDGEETNCPLCDMDPCIC